ncbi:MAG: glycerol kinase GlpK [Deltaproteobacteria bacterium]|nr:glycerol kinase GlpK [Deltaproteobacteria bacterium]
MNHEYIMAIDQGTTGSRAMVVNSKGEVVSNAYKEFPQIYPMPGWVEHDPEVIWETTLSVMKQSMDKAAIGSDNIRAIGITNQRETTVLWDKNTLKPIGNAIVWQCRRSSSICDDLKRQGLSPLFQEKTGLVIDAYFSATKIKWMLDNIADARKRARAGEIAFGTIDSWLIAKLTKGKVHVTDYTNASRTLIFNIHEKEWDTELLGIFDIPVEMLPRVVPSSGVAGQTDPSILGTAIPIAGIAGDQQAALFGQACFDKGQVKNTYGTGCFMLLNLGDASVKPTNGLLLTLACNAEGKPCYALEGSVFIAGAVIQWLRDGLGLIESAAQSQDIAMLVEDTGGVYLVPAFAGLGAPYWDMYARGAITGITRSTTKAHIVRAALEGIAYQVKDLTQAFEETTGEMLTELRVDGGASRNDLLMQFQSDILGIPVDRSSYIESTGMGAAFLAGLSTGMWESGNEIKALRATERRFEPSITQGKRDELYAGWLDAVERVKSGRNI